MAGPICGALKDNGDTCQRQCKTGFTRCYIHGAASPAAKAKAEQMMALLRMPAIEVLHNIIETLNKTIDQWNANTCLTCGFPSGDLNERDSIIRACMTAAKTCAAVLDRCGLGPRATLELKQSDGDLDLALLTDDERARMMKSLSEFKAVKEEARARINGVIHYPQPKQTM